MNTTIYATILTGLGIVITMVVVMYALAMKIRLDIANRRIDDLRHDARRWIDDTDRRIDELRRDLLAAMDNKSRVNHASSTQSK